jgi:hypothetical protein
MHADSTRLPAPAGRTPDAWTLLTGGSVALVAGFGGDLLRLGLHRAGRARAAMAAWQRRPMAARGWRCPNGCN